MNLFLEGKNRKIECPHLLRRAAIMMTTIVDDTSDDDYMVSGDHVTCSPMKGGYPAKCMHAASSRASQYYLLLYSQCLVRLKEAHYDR